MKGKLMKVISAILTVFLFSLWFAWFTESAPQDISGEQILNLDKGSHSVLEGKTTLPIIIESCEAEISVQNGDTNSELVTMAQCHNGIRTTITPDEGEMMTIRIQEKKDIGNVTVGKDFDGTLSIVNRWVWYVLLALIVVVSTYMFRD